MRCLELLYHLLDDSSARLPLDSRLYGVIMRQKEVQKKGAQATALPPILWLLNSVTGTLIGFSDWFTPLPTEATCDKPSNQVISIFLHYLMLYVYGKPRSFFF